MRTRAVLLSLAAFAGGAVAALAQTPAQPATSQPAPAAAQGGHADLRARFKVGDVLRYQFHVVSEDTRGEAPGDKPEAPEKTPEKRGGDQTLDLTFRITAAGDKGTEAEVTIDTIRMSTQMTSGVAAFDSTKPDEPGNPLAMNFRPLVGYTIKVVVAPDGSVTSVTPAKELPGSIARNADALGATPEKFALRYSPVFSLGKPEADVAAGAAWTTKSHAAILSNLGIDLAYAHTLSAVAAGTATIRSEASGSIDTETANAAAASKPELTHALTRTSRWNTATGRLESYEGTTRTTLTITGADAKRMVIRQSAQSSLRPLP